MDVLKKNLIVAIISQYIHILNRLIVQLKKITSYSLNIYNFYLSIIPQKSWEKKQSLESYLQIKLILSAPISPKHRAHLQASAQALAPGNIANSEVWKLRPSQF